MTDYVPTGIDGLDSILGGGLVRNSAVLIIGNPGTGKSIMSMQYLYHGVKEQDEKGIYLSFEESSSDLEETATSIGFKKWGEYVDNEDIRVYDKMDLLDEAEFSMSLSRLLGESEVSGFDRLAMDSLTMFEMFFEDERKKRTYLLKLIDLLKHNGLTSFLTRESKAVFPDRDIGPEEFLTDGNIYLAQTPTSSKSNRYIWVAKMRKQKIDTQIFPIEITDGGIVIHESAAGFSYMESSEIDEGRGP